MTRTVPLVIVMEPSNKRVRCVYLNDHRIVGGKPYVSEGLPHHHYAVASDHLKNAGLLLDERASFSPGSAAERDAIAEAIRGAPVNGEPPWERLAEDRKDQWRADADRVLAVLEITRAGS